MKTKDEDLENLSGHSLPAPKEKDDDLFNIPQLEDSLEQIENESIDEDEESNEDEQSQRMIDMPFNLFDE